MTRYLIAAVFIAGLATTAYAQRGMCRHGGIYDPATETTLTGTVEAVNNVPSPRRGAGGLHLTLTTASGAVDVHVGPASFVAAKNIAFEAGDPLTVVGSKVTMAGQEVVIAREITKGGQVLTLRDARGFPAWSGRARTW